MNFFSTTSHIFSPKFWPGDGLINYSSTISDIDHIFEFLEREFHGAYLMIYKFVDMMFGTWVN